MRAADISRRWVGDIHDFETIGHLIEDIGAQKLLDIGCGNGRLFALYSKYQFRKVIGQDISEKALEMASEKISGSNIELLCTPIEKLSFTDQYFDLVVSARVLSAVLPDDINLYISHLARLGKYFYINEMTTSDYAPGSPYWFLHDYHALFENNNCRLVKKGIFADENETWYLFAKMNVEAQFIDNVI